VTEQSLADAKAMPALGSATAADVTTADLGSSAVPTYARKATGLVRSISPSNALMLNMVNISIPLALLIVTVAPFALPGVNLFWLVVLTVGFSILPTATYAILAAAMPRSGGDYVWQSRILHPSVGFASNVNFTIGTLFFNGGILATWVSGFAASSVLLTLGTVQHSPTLIHWAAIASEKRTQLIVGIIVLALFAALTAVSTRAMLRFTGALFWLSILGTVPVLFLMLIHGHSDFVHSFNHYASYHSIFTLAASKATFTYGHHHWLAPTLAAMPLAFTSFGYGMISTYASGEIKSARKSSFYTTVGALLITGALVAVLVALAMHVFSMGFLGSIGALANTKAYPLASQPFFYLFVSMLTTSPILQVIIGVGFIAGLVAVFGPTFLMGTRNMLAWSLDRVAPMSLSEVNRRTATPIKSTIVCTVIMGAFMGVFLYAPVTWTTYLFVPAVMTTFTFIIVCLSGAVFPWRCPAIYAASPYRWQIGTLPGVTIVCLFAAAYGALIEYYFLTTPALGLSSTAALVSIPVVFSAAFVWYGVARVIQRRRGIDLSLATKELPPE
jgi:amino acid transporter